MKTRYEKRFKYGFTDYVKGKKMDLYRLYYLILILSVIFMGSIF
ncbi:hypothetical protein [Nafulsella turpanensis]|nr:hypothetical protein [Nafulsella turpanensis]